MKMITSALTLAQQSVSALYVDALTSRRAISRNTRSNVRTAYFHSRAKIREASAGDFCRSITKSQSLSAVCKRPLELPAECTEANLGVGSPAYYLTLAAITSSFRPANVVEFGTFLGFGASIFALNAPKARILTIDLPDEVDDAPYLNAPDRRHVKVSRNQVGKCYRSTDYESRITELRCDSRYLTLEDHVPSADLVLIDGGHDTGCITADTRNAFAVAHPGTVILWDDYFWLYPDVVRFLNDLADRHKLVRIQNTSVVGHIVG